MGDFANSGEIAQQKKAMRWSVAAGFLMLAGKGAAWYVTGSAAILSDAAESVIHIGAVLFAALSLYMVTLPPDRRSPYGYDRIAFMSAGFEGGMIMVAAVWIIVVAVQKWLAGIPLAHLGIGTVAVLGAATINLVLGRYLVNTGRAGRSLILEANGRHVLTDAWTSFGVVVGLLLVIVTGWKPFDPLCAIGVALNILWSGGQLVHQSFRGLMDLPDPIREEQLRRAVDEACNEVQASYHRLRHRDTGQHVIVSLHLLFPFRISLGEAHRRATMFEAKLAAVLPYPIEVVSHLESIEDHDVAHPHEPAGWN